MPKEKRGCGCFSVVFLGVLITVVIAVISPPDTWPTRPAAPAIDPIESKPPAIEPFALHVTNTNTKKIGKEYRYFFSIRNNDNKPFSGEVEITLIRKDGNMRADSESFGTTAPIPPDGGNAVFFDTSRGPSSLVGNLGAVSFEWEATTQGQKVANGKGSITTKE